MKTAMGLAGAATGPDKDHPDAEWIASLRRRFVIEREIDQVLTRKLERRSGPAFKPLSLETLTQGVEALLRTQVRGDFRISEARWLSGGASKLQMAFMLDWTPPGKSREATPLVLRMEPSESIVETSRRREFQLIKAMEGVVPVPLVYWCDANGEHLPYPALIYGFAPGVAKPSASESKASGAGTQVPRTLGAKLAPQFIDHLAKIHSFDWRGAELDAFQVPEPGTTQVAEWGLNWWERVWEEDGDEEIPLLRVAANWLRRNLPVLQDPVIVHSDYRMGNFLFDEQEGRITAWLDWELGRIGDRHQDLAWTTSNAFVNLDDDGKTLLVCGLVPEQRFMEEYERLSGARVDPKTLHWYKIYNNYSLAVLLIGTGYRASRNGKTHQDILVTWLIGIGSLMMDQMRALLEQGN